MAPPQAQNAVAASTDLLGELGGDTTAQICNECFDNAFGEQPDLFGEASKADDAGDWADAFGGDDSSAGLSLDFVKAPLAEVLQATT